LPRPEPAIFPRRTIDVQQTRHVRADPPGIAAILRIVNTLAAISATLVSFARFWSHSSPSNCGSMRNNHDRKTISLTWNVRECELHNAACELGNYPDFNNHTVVAHYSPEAGTPLVWVRRRLQETLP